jgi:hypothetical protein
MNLIQVKSWNIERGDDICAAMLMGSFTRYLYRELDDPAIETNLSGRIDTGFDRLHGGCLFLSFTAMAVLEDLVDWDRWQDQGGGVLAYEHLEADDDKPYSDPGATDLAAFLLREIPEAAWYEIAENWDVPNNTELTDLLTRWCRACKLPLVGDEAADDGESALAPLILVSPATPERRCDSLPYDFEDFGLNLTELQDKYAAEQEHPEYTNQRWGREAPTTPYWDWVMACLAKDDDATE